MYFSKSYKKKTLYMKLMVVKSIFFTNFVAFWPSSPNIFGAATSSVES